MNEREQSDKPDDGDSLSRKGGILRGGIRVSGALVATWLSKLLGPGAGSVAAQTFVEAADVLVGALEGRERDRVASALEETYEKVRAGVEEGKRIRPEIVDPESEQALAIFETVVDAAARSIEAKKCRVISAIYASIVLDDEISPEDGLLYLRRVREASWRQLVALRYCEDAEREEERERIGAAGGEGDIRISPVLSMELSEASRSLELIGIRQTDGSVVNPSNVMNGGQISSASVTRLAPTGLGMTISRLGRLDEFVTAAEMNAIASALGSG